MFSSPRHLRLAIAGFLAVGTAISWNVLAQEKVAPSLASKSDAVQRAAHDRNRRLALEPKEAQAVKEARTRTATAPATAAPSPPSAGTEMPLINRVGRLSPGFKLERPAGTAEITPDTIRMVQQRLAGLGYFTAKIDGRTSEDTERAIREYEMDSGLVPTGKVTSALVDRLTRSVGIAKPAPAAAKPPAR